MRLYIYYKDEDIDQIKVIRFSSTLDEKVLYNINPKFYINTKIVTNLTVCLLFT